jgi:OFA family oxalate/formate antiporter-like MFS transporter
MILGFVIMSLVCLGSFLIKNPPNFKATVSNMSNVEIGPRQMLRTTKFWLLWAIFAFSASAGLMIIGNLATFTKLVSTTTYGLSKEDASWIAAFAVGLIAVFNGLGRLLAGWASDKIGRDKVILILFGLESLLLFTLPQASLISSYMMLTWIALIGFCFGSCFSILPSATADYFGTKNLGVNYGVMFSAYGFGGILGPQIMAFMLDSARGPKGSIVVNDYTNPFFFAGLLGATAALLSFLLKKSSLKQA